jgi:hypothetical protein
MVHQLCEVAEGVAPIFLLQRTSPVVALSGPATDVRFLVISGNPEHAAPTRMTLSDMAGATVLQCARCEEMSESISPTRVIP